MVLTLPLILEDYYDEIEYNPVYFNNDEVLEDADYIIGELSIGQWYDCYSKSDISNLKRFRTMLKNNIICSCIIHKY